MPHFRNLHEWFLSNYHDFGLDYYVLRFGLLGVDKYIRDADVICSSSSKGLFGYDAEILSANLSRPGHPVRVYNLSFGYGEGFGYLMEVIKTLDLRDKLLVADLTDNTSQYHFTGMAKVALESATWLDAYKVLLERWLTFGRDWLMQERLPKIQYSQDRGFTVAAHLDSGLMYRQLKTGNLMPVAAKAAQSAQPGHYSFGFRFDQLRAPFFEECRRRNIKIIFTSIPYKGYDLQWGQSIARQLGDYPHLAIAPDGIELFDSTHMSAQGRQLFSERLARQLLPYVTKANSSKLP